MLKALGICNKFLISRLWTHNPIFLTHSVTAKCNCRCKICGVWRDNTHKTDELTTQEVFHLLDEAKSLNFVAYVALGGEPLMRPDILEIMKYAHALGFYTSLITNGTLLKENAKAIAQAVDLTWVSLDYDSQYHDLMRGYDGAFRKAQDGIVELKQFRGRVAINCVLSNLNLDAIQKMGDLARKLGVKLAFDTMEAFGENNENYALTPAQRQYLFLKIADLKTKGYPILNSDKYVKNQERSVYSCMQPRIFLRVFEDGQIRPFWCQKSQTLLGDLRKQSLNQVLHSSSFKRYVSMTDGCNLCCNSTTVETSLFYSSRFFYESVIPRSGVYTSFLKNYVL